MLIVTRYYIIIKIKKTKTSGKDLKKVGIMRINSYKKFFAKVAEIMNTSIKDVEPLDGGYRVKLANHVNVRVFRGVGGSLFIHDHRGIAPITSCYDFEDFKTMTELYDRLVSDYAELVEVEEPEEPEEAVKDVMEVKQELNARFGKEQYFDTDSVQPNKTIIAKIENINYCPNQNTCCAVSPYVHCDYNYKSDACIKAHKNFIHYCAQVHKQLKTISNPNWHIVKLATVNSNDFIRLNEKLKLYISVYRDLKQTISYLRKCKNINTYDRCYVNYIKKQNDMLAKGKFTNAMLNFIRVKLSMQNVESGVWASDCEHATGFHKSRRYNKSRIDL